jgi:serine/threonine protein kinase
METLKLNIVRQLKTNMRYTPDWFIPSERVNDNKEVFANGSLGTLYKGSWNNGKDYIVKCFHLNEELVGIALYDQIGLEMDKWFGHNHPHIHKMYGGSHVSDPAFIVCEYGSNGNLNMYLKKNKHKKWRMLYEAVLGLEYLHERNIVHGNLRLNNILVGNDGKAKLSDIGLNTIRKSSLLSSVSNGSVHLDDELQWRAPECLSKNDRCVSYESGFASDVYSFGMCLIEAVTFASPFALLDTYDNSSFVESDENHIKPESFSDEEWELIISMIHLDPNKRVNLEYVVMNLKSFAEKEGNTHSNEHIVYCLVVV